MAKVAGYTASVEFTTIGITAGIKSISVKRGSRMIDITEFIADSDPDYGWDKVMAGLKNFGADVQLHYDTDNTADVGDTGTLTVTLGTVVKAGTVFIENITEETPVDGGVTQSVTLRGSGAYAVVA